MLKVLILEDEEYTRRFLKKIVSEVPVVSEVIATSNGSEAVAVFQQHNFNIVMLDIELEADKLNGIEIAKVMYNLKPDVSYIFVTGYSKYAIDSFAVHPYDYILKPINQEKIIETLSSLASKNVGLSNNPSTKLIIKDQSETIFIPLEDIIFIEKIKNCDIKIHTEKNIIKTYHNLNEIEKKLDNNFLRVHRSYIVNRNKIAKITDLGNRSFEIEFAGYKHKALMSRNNYKELKNIFAP